MGVPSTVDSVREQIKEAVKLVADTYGTVLLLADSWSKYSDKAKYPVFKAFYGLSNLDSRYFNNLDSVTDELFIQIAPWCSETDYEIETSKVIESFRKSFDTDTVRAQMYSTYQSKLGKITPIKAELINSNIANPYAVVQFTLSVTYFLDSK